MIRVLIMIALCLCLSPMVNAEPTRGIARFHQTSYSSTGTSGNYAFIVTDSDSGERDAVTTRKTADPTIKAVYYDNALTHGSTYYVLDTRNSEHIVHDTWGWVLMDISNSSYRASLAAQIASDLSTYTMFDGVFLDDVWYSITASDFHRETTGDDPSLPADLVTNWKTHMAALLDAIKTAIGSKLLVVNGGIYEASYISRVDGLFDESFAHANWEDADTWGYGSSPTWNNHLATISGIIGASKYYFAQSGIDDGASAAAIAKVVRFSLASYLMSIPTSGSSYYLHGFTPSMTYSGDYWQSQWEVVSRMGAAGAAFALASGESSTYRRDFTSGCALVNIGTSTSGSITVNGVAYTVPAHDGLIVAWGGTISNITIGPGVSVR